MTTHYSSLASEISWTEETGRIQSMGLQRVGHDLTLNNGVYLLTLLLLTLIYPLSPTRRCRAFLVEQG